MDILIVSATYLEVEMLIQHFNANKVESNLYSFTINKLKVEILITGIGMTATTFHLTDRVSNHSYDYILNMGICGSFNKDFPIGKVIAVSEQYYGDLGFENEENHFTPFKEKDFPSSEQDFNKFSFKRKEPIEKEFLHLSFVKSITVNKVHGLELSINKVVEIYNPDIESMEGLAVFFVCLHKNIPFLEVRAVSNYVEKRNKDNWNIPLAIKNLTTEIIKICLSFEKA